MGGNWPRSASCVHSTTTVPQPPHDTALGLARQRFVDSLGQKAGELRGALALLVGSPDAARPRDDFRARLQALYASAQVFRMNVLAAALQEGAAVLDLARTEGREVSQAELEAVDIRPLANYQVGSTDIMDLWHFIEHQTTTIGHIDGEGHCETIREG